MTRHVALLNTEQISTTVPETSFSIKGKVAVHYIFLSEVLIKIYNVYQTRPDCLMIY